MPEVSRPFSQAQIEIGWPRTLFMFVLLLVIMLTAIQLVFKSYHGILASRADALAKEISDLSTTIPAEDVSALVTLDLRIKNLKTLLDQHRYASKVFDELESVTHPQVRWTSVGIDLSRQQMFMRGFAPSMAVISLQVSALSKSTLFTSTVINNANSTTGGFQFNVTVVLNRQLLLPQVQ